jgi:hypothetical protein
MKLSDTFRENAANCAQLAESSASAPAVARYLRMETAWLDLAIQQDWLDGEIRETEKPRHPEGCGCNFS